MSDLTLVIMAAGMGSRFGGLKQIEPIGPNGEFIIDYSIYDAKRAGFNKVVFIIKEENYELFKETVGKRLENKIEVAYAFQKPEDIPEGFTVPKDRTKPWGTTQAILATRNIVKGDFAVINADDFYGKESYQEISDFFKAKQGNEYLLVGYILENTLTDNGSTKRGVCEEKDGYLSAIYESVIAREGNSLIASPQNGDTPFEVQPDAIVSMNMFGFTDDLYKYSERDLKNFFEKNRDNLERCERLIADTVYDIVKSGEKKVRLVHTTSKWQGITYKEDKQKLVDEIAELIRQGVYPEKL